MLSNLSFAKEKSAFHPATSATTAGQSPQPIRIAAPPFPSTLNSFVYNLTIAASPNECPTYAMRSEPLRTSLPIATSPLRKTPSASPHAPLREPHRSHHLCRPSVLRSECQQLKPSLSTLCHSASQRACTLILLSKTCR